MFDQEALEQEFDVEDEEINEALKQEEAEEESPEPEIDHKEPAPKLHISKDDWVASGRDPAKWVSPELFAETTRRINETSKLRQENQRIHARLTNVAFLQQQQIARLKADLESRRDDAIDVGDRTAVKSFDRQLRDLDAEESLTKEPVQQQANIPPEVAEWNEENAWLTAGHPLKSVANDVFVKAMNDGKTIAGALRLVDKELAKHKDEPSQKKVASRSMVDSPSRGAVSRSDSVGLRFEDCTREEKDMFNEFYKPSGATVKEFLKDLSLARKGN